MPVVKTFYLRNLRPNRVQTHHDGTKYVWERRGTREDSVPVTEEVYNSPVVSRWVRTGILEDISKDAYMDLAARTVDEVAPLKKGQIRDVAIQIGKEASVDFSSGGKGPTEISPEEMIRVQKELMVPKPEWVTEPEPTPDPKAVRAAAKAAKK